MTDDALLEQCLLRWEQSLGSGRELKTAELAKLIANARQEFQAWLNATVPPEGPAEPL